MLQHEARENTITNSSKKSKENCSILKTDAKIIENYSNLIIHIVSEMGYIIPDNKNEHDPLRQVYLPSMKYRECLRDLQKLLSKIYHHNLDIFDLIRCRIGEWKLLQSHFLPMLIQLIHSAPIGNNDIFILLEIINVLIFSVDDDETVKPAYFNDLIHYNCIYKKHFSHISVMGALTTLLASSMSYCSKSEINYEPLKQVSKLLKNILLSPEAESLKGNLIHNLAYGRKESVIRSMYKSKMCDLLFSFTSSAGDRAIFKNSNPDVSLIFSDIFCIVASIFDDIDVSQLIPYTKVRKSEEIADSQKSFKKPIRHGRFSGSVSVQLSTGENVVINNSKLFVSGIPGSLDFTLKRNGKLEGKMSSQTRNKVNLAPEDRELFLKISIEFLESHFNTLFGTVADTGLSFELLNQHRKSLISIASYFMSFCRTFISESDEKNDYYKLIYGMINVKQILDNIDYLHELISSKHYPSIVKLLPYFKELLLLIQDFAASGNEQRAGVSRNIQKQLLHSKNVLLLVRRVIMISKPVMKYFLQICIDCNDILFKLTKKYSESHNYWYVSSLSCAEIYSRENDSEDSNNFNIGNESNFNFESLIKHYSSREVVDFYCHGLMNCNFESKEFNSKVARYLYFVLKSEHFSKSIMRPSIVVQLQNVITGSNSWMAQNKDLVVVSNKIIRKFSSLIISDPSFLVMSFFN